jgi:DNA polymerase
MTRLGEKSTLFETRVAKFITAGRMAGGRLPVPLRYCGADTTGRDSGEEYNCQNLPRITPGNPKPTDALRRSMRAPSGYVVGVADQSGIELRVNHFLWKVPSSMALYEASPDKGDLYRAFASENLYGVPPDEITKPQRQVGKIAQLGLGFGAGSVTFQRVAKIMGGIDLPLESEDPDEMSATRVVDVWRAAYPEIVKGWKRANLCLTYIPKGIEVDVDPWGLVQTCREGFVLPSGRLIRYPDLREDEDGRWADGQPKRSWFYGQGRHKARINGPKAVENIVQALARDSIFDCALEFFKRTGLRPSLRVHDELVYVFPKPQGPALLDELQRVMRTPPKWWPQLVVWSEGDLADTYGDAK